MVNRRGVQLDPIQYLYQREWIKTHWKESNLLHFGLSAENEEEGDKEEVVAVRDSFDVELTAIDVAQKIKIIKTLRETFGLGLKEAKEFADKVPSMLKKNVKKEEAEKLKKTLDAAGCVITLK